MTTPAIHRLTVPTPFLVGDVNAYLLTGSPLTLVDTGPNLATSLTALETELVGHGVRIEDLELIVLTHQHTDHIGLTSVLRERSGALVAAFAPMAPWLAAFGESAAADDEYARALMARHGVSEELNAALAATAFAARAFGSSGRVDLELLDGSVLEAGDRIWQVLHRPGHSPSDLLLWDEVDGVVLGGDHLMHSVASNAILTRPFGAPGSLPETPESPPSADERPHPLRDYRESLRKTAELPDGTVILPGHGSRVCAHRDLISERLRVHERRARKIVRTLRAGQMTAHEIALSMWGRMAITQAPLMMSEVLGYLDMLTENGLVDEQVVGERVLFGLAAGSRLKQ